VLRVPAVFGLNATLIYSLIIIIIIIIIIVIIIIITNVKLAYYQKGKL